jgi:hypothetical protein
VASGAIRIRWRCWSRGRALSAFYHDSLDITDAHHREVSAIRLIAKLPTLVAMCYKYTMGQPFVYPRNELSYAANFMRMMFSVPCEDYKVNDVLVRALDRIFTLHADHEQNASTSTVRLAGSSGANPFACIAAGIACLWGPAHGGANEAALNMLEEIGGRVEDRRFHQARQGQEFGRQADGLRPPRVQALRSARQADAEDLPRGARGARLHDDPCSSWRWRWRRSRSRTSTSSAQALSERRLLFGHRPARDRAFPSACSPRSSRWRARSAGSRSGTR